MSSRSVISVKSWPIFQGRRRSPPQIATTLDAGEEIVYAVDFQDIRGQEHAKRALEIACAGNHNVRMVGPPGSGKTLMARALPLDPAGGNSVRVPRDHPHLFCGR